MKKLITKNLDASSLEKPITADGITDPLSLKKETSRIARNNHQAILENYPRSFINVDTYTSHT